MRTKFPCWFNDLGGNKCSKSNEGSLLQTDFVWFWTHCLQQYLVTNLLKIILTGQNLYLFFLDMSRARDFPRHPTQEAGYDV